MTAFRNAMQNMENTTPAYQAEAAFSCADSSAVNASVIIILDAMIMASFIIMSLFNLITLVSLITIIALINISLLVVLLGIKHTNTPVKRITATL